VVDLALVEVEADEVDSGEEVVEEVLEEIAADPLNGPNSVIGSAPNVIS
jgi:hypothetical protein